MNVSCESVGALKTPHNDLGASNTSQSDVAASKTSQNGVAASQMSLNDVAASQTSQNGANGCSTTARVVTISDSSDSEEENDDVHMWDDSDDTGEALTARCLFCDACVVLSTFVAHCRDTHCLDIPALLIRDGGDHSQPPTDLQYAFIQLVNYVRTHGVSAEVLVSQSAAEWRCDRYMQPVLADDLLLTLDIEEFVDGDDDAGGSGGGGGDIGDGEDMEKTRLRQTIHQMNDQMQQMMTDIATLRAALCRLVDDDKKPSKSQQRLPSEISTETGRTNVVSRTAVESYPTSDQDSDRAYFDTYSDSAIHREMISDLVRTNTYRRAIEYLPLEGCGVVAGRRVLDLGCGSGILALLCARAGASHVLAVDASSAARDLALDAVHENGRADVVSVKHARVETLCRSDSGCESGFDVIVSEWMGYMLLFEGMLESVLWARDHLLAPGGCLLPDSCTLSVCAISDVNRWRDAVGQWRDGSVCDGIRLSCLARGALRSASVELVAPETCCSDPQQLLALDLNTCTVEELQFTASFQLTVHRDSCFTALAVYFGVEFGTAQGVGFGTAPCNEPTHWKQTVLYLPEPRKCLASEVVRGTFFCGQCVDDTRSLRVVLTIDGVSHKYVLS